MKELQIYLTETIKNHPELKSEILDLYELCLMEIEMGESEEHEISLCINSIKNLINQ